MIDISLSFLDQGQYNVLLVCDHGERSDAVVLENGTVQRGSTIEIEMSNGGGFVGRFSKE